MAVVREWEGLWLPSVAQMRGEVRTFAMCSRRRRGCGDWLGWMRVVAGGWRSDGVGKGSWGLVRRSLVDARKVRMEA